MNKSTAGMSHEPRKGDDGPRAMLYPQKAPIPHVPANIGDPSLIRVKVQTVKVQIVKVQTVDDQTERRQFNEPLEVRRRLTRVLMSYCVPLKEAMRNGGPKSLMRTIRDDMIVYYEAYKLPESGFIHGGKHCINILCSGC